MGTSTTTCAYSVPTSFTIRSLRFVLDCFPERQTPNIQLSSMYRCLDISHKLKLKTMFKIMLFLFLLKRQIFLLFCLGDCHHHSLTSPSDIFGRPLVDIFFFLTLYPQSMAILLILPRLYFKSVSPYLHAAFTIFRSFWITAVPPNHFLLLQFTVF